MTFSEDKDVISKNKTTEIEETEASCHMKNLSLGLYLLLFKLLSQKSNYWKADMSGWGKISRVFYSQFIQLIYYNFTGTVVL